MPIFSEKELKSFIESDIIKDIKKIRGKRPPISLANNSSDLLVQLAKEFALKNGLKLIQYSINPKTLRIQLLSMKEIKDPKDYSNSIEVLKAFRKEFREKLVRLKKLVENE